MKSCLVVDDSRVIRMVARKILEELGLEVIEAENGQVALDKCSAKMPDGVLLDWNMPVMDGFNFMVEMRKMPNSADVKIVFCTTENDISNIQKAVSAGANEYIMKPFDKDIVESKFIQVGLL